MASTIIVGRAWITDGRGECSACGCRGIIGASCDVCTRAAYQRLIRVTIAGEREAVAAHGRRCDLVRIMQASRSDLLAGLTGHDTIRDILPGARMQAPEVP